MRFFRLAILIVFSLALLPMAGKAQGGQSYTTITSLVFSPLSNGVQIRVKADGILQMRIGGNNDNGNVYGARMEFSFPDARNGIGKNFFTSKLYPVSYAQLSTAPGAKNGIGLNLVVSNLINTQASVTKMDDGEGILITVQSDRTVERAGRAKDGAAAADAKGAQEGAADTSTRVRFKNGKLTLRAVGVDIHQFMSAIAQTTGFSIAVDDAVDRKVSINLLDADPTAALQTIATAYGLALSRIGGIYMMSEGVPTDLATYHLSGTQSYRMQNTQAGIASGLLPNFLYSYAHVNSEQNAVVVTAPSQMLAKIGADLNKVDIPSPEISIEAIAVEFTDTKNLNIGLSLTNQQSAIFGSVDSPTGVITYNTIGKLPVDFEATLNALELKGKARVRARPRMAAVNGRTANIFIGAQRFILTQFNQSGQTQTRIQPVDVGVKLSVTPLTGGNGEITTRISPEVSNITELDLQTGLPVLSTRRADTTVRIKDGETIAIGGLSLDQEQITRSKIPILGDIPLIGNLFRSKSESRVRTELVVFVTPHILTAEDLSTAPTVAPAPTPAPK